MNRGGAPLHFLIERVTLTWPDGLVGLRVPSIVFFLLALPAAGLVAGRLVDARAATLLPLALACAPLAVGLATFGRMYSLFLAATLWATVLALWAARRDSLLGWTLAGYRRRAARLHTPGGADLLGAGRPHGVPLRDGSLPTAAEDGLAGAARAGARPGALLRGRPRRSPRPLRGGAGSAARAGDPSGRPLRARARPDRAGARELAGSLFVLGLALAGVAWLAWDRPRVSIALALWGLVPVAFFTFVPTGTTFFFPRYLLPALPFFLLMAIAGCLALASFGRIGTVVGALLFAGLLAWQLVDDVQKLDELQQLRLVALAVEAEEREPELVFGAAGSLPFARRPPRRLDEYVVLERRDAVRAPEGNPEALAAFVASDAEPATGVWIFGGPPATMAAAKVRFEDVPRAEVVAVSPSVLLVRSAQPLKPRPLVELAASVREAWLAEVPDDREAEQLLLRDRYALAAS